jgi:hypothetical protein
MHLPLGVQCLAVFLNDAVRISRILLVGNSGDFFLTSDKDLVIIFNAFFANPVCNDLLFSASDLEAF